MQVAEGTEQIVTADVVLDCGGRHVGLIGLGGIAVPYESKERFRTIEFRMGSLSRYANKSVLVVGNEWTAAWMVTTLVELMDQEPNTTVTWVTRHSIEDANVPFPLAATDPLMHVENS